MVAAASASFGAEARAEACGALKRELPLVLGAAPKQAQARVQLDLARALLGAASEAELQGAPDRWAANPRNPTIHPSDTTPVPPPVPHCLVPVCLYSVAAATTRSCKTSSMMQLMHGVPRRLLKSRVSCWGPSRGLYRFTVWVDAQGAAAAGGGSRGVRGVGGLGAGSGGVPSQRAGLPQRAPAAAAQQRRERLAAHVRPHAGGGLTQLAVL